MTTLYVLGAADPEMAVIERTLRACFCSVVHATRDGRGVHPGNAYEANGVDEGCDEYDRVVLIECDLPGWFQGNFGDPESPQPRIHRIDHHRPGDPGYGQPPERFFSASSIGQLLALLDRPITADHTGVTIDELLQIAAADHCLEAAYRARCPEVDPDSLMRWRAASRAAFQSRPIAAVEADIEAARTQLRVARHCPCCRGERVGHADLRDLTDHPPVPELSEAAAREGVPFLATTIDRDGRKKVVLQAAQPELVSEFMSDTSQFVEGGLIDIYGDPQRGFAGGYAV